MDVLNELASCDNESPASFDGQFWMWESLEEVLLANVETMSVEDFQTALQVFSTNYKGSMDLLNLFEERMYRETDIWNKMPEVDEATAKQ